MLRDPAAPLGTLQASGPPGVWNPHLHPEAVGRGLRQTRGAKDRTQSPVVCAHGPAPAEVTGGWGRQSLSHLSSGQDHSPGRTHTREPGRPLASRGRFQGPGAPAEPRAAGLSPPPHQATLPEIPTDLTVRDPSAQGASRAPSLPPQAPGCSLTGPWPQPCHCRPRAGPETPPAQRSLHPAPQKASAQGGP